MSVIVRAPDGRHLVLAKGLLSYYSQLFFFFHETCEKGAPEEIAKHCLVDSLPANFAAILASYTAKGCLKILFCLRFS